MRQCLMLTRSVPIFGTERFLLYIRNPVATISQKDLQHESGILNGDTPGEAGWGFHDSNHVRALATVRNISTGIPCSSEKTDPMRIRPYGKSC